MARDLHVILQRDVVKLGKEAAKFTENFLKNGFTVHSRLSDALGRSVRLRISANALRTVEHRGGLDAFLVKADGRELSQRARLLKKQVAKKLAGVDVAA